MKNIGLGSSTAQKFKYNGKELNEELGLNMYDYGARFYDPAVGRWFTPDALAEKYLNQSPYNYALNNPVLYIDPDGNQVEMCCERLLGTLQAIGGAIEVAGGAIGVLAPEPITTVGGTLLIANGLDNLQAGLRTLWTGNSTDTVLHQGVEAGAEILGADTDTANKIATGTEIAAGLAGVFKGGLKLLKSADEVADVAKLSEDAISSLQKEKKFLTNAMNEDLAQLQKGKDLLVKEAKLGNVSNKHGLVNEVNNLIPKSIQYKQNRIDEINNLLNN